MQKNVKKKLKKIPSRNFKKKRKERKQAQRLKNSQH
jgi:hypothetical protein